MVGKSQTEVGLSSRARAGLFAVSWLVVGLPCAMIHLAAQPDDAPISLLQRGVAALANFFGPWGVVIVRVVDFPNAGLRSFSWTLALTMTLTGGLLLVLGVRCRRRSLRLFFAGLWAVFTLIWFGVGLRQIADGLL